MSFVFRRVVWFVVALTLSGWVVGQARERVGDVVRLEPQVIAPGEHLLRLEVTLPQGYKFNDLAPFSMTWTSSDDSAVLAEGAEQTIVEPTFPLEVPVILTEGETTLTGDLLIYYCEYEAVGVCLFKQARLEVPVRVSSEGQNDLTAHFEVKPPEDFNSIQ